jgi:hypothetical protein
MKRVKYLLNKFKNELSFKDKVWLLLAIFAVFYVGDKLQIIINYLDSISDISQNIDGVGSNIANAIDRK